MEHRGVPEELRREEPQRIRDVPLRETWEEPRGVPVTEDASHDNMDSDGDDPEDDATMGFIGSIVPAKDDDVANTLLEQLGGVRVRAKPAGDPSLGEQPASYLAGRHSANLVEQMGHIVGQLHKHN